jgi:hypothetical protein
LAPRERGGRGDGQVALKALDPHAQPLDIRAAAREELATEAHIEMGSTDDVGHECVAGHEPAAWQCDREGTNVHAVASAGPSLGEVASQRRLETLLAFTLDGAALARERGTGRELAQELEQRQVRPSSGLELVSLGLRDDDRTTRDGHSQGRLELTEGGLPFHHPAQVVLIEVGVRVSCYAPSTSAARS